MNENSTYYTNLITRYFSGETSEDELRVISDWLKADPRNEEEFRQLQKIWQLLEKHKINSSVNTDLEWIEIQKKYSLFSR